MALNEKIQVEMPEHCVRVPRNGRIYIQYTKRSYRNAQGKPTSERVAIGRLDEKTGKLIPNRTYYELFGEEMPQKAPEVVKKYGTYAAFYGSAKQLGLVKLLKKHFGTRADKIMTVAQYMFSEGNVMYYMEDWQEETLTVNGETLGGAALSRLFASITESERMAFFKDWLKLKKSSEFIAYDVTSISSFGKGNTDLEWGYNRDKEKLPQINLGMFYGEETKLPLYYRIYPGSITDKAHLRCMMEDTGLLHTKKSRYVMDRGFYSEKNLQFLTEAGCRFVIALPEHLKYCQNLIMKHKDEIINRSACYLGPEKPYGKAFDVTELGFRMKVHLYYDPDKAARDSAFLMEEIQKQENELSEMKEPPDKGLHYDKYFLINRAKDGSLAFLRNFSAIDDALARCGFFLIAETDFKKNSAEILDIYRRRDVIEKGFDNLKNELDMRRMYVHSEGTAQGKAFCAFLALIVHSHFRNVLNDYLDSHHFTFQKLLTTLDKTRRVYAPSAKSGSRFLNPHSKTVREVFDLLGIPLLLEELV